MSSVSSHHTTHLPAPSVADDLAAPHGYTGPAQGRQADGALNDSQCHFFAGSKDEDRLHQMMCNPEIN